MQTLPPELHTLRDFVRWGTSRFNQAGLFFGHGTDNAVDEAMTLVLHALHLSHDLPEALWQANLTLLEKQHILDLFQQRLEKRLPAAYITQQAWFAGLSFYVDQRVLIPRSPTAELIQQGFEPWLHADQVTRVLDLCTGGGCIAIATALALPNAQVDAADLSADALAVAARNVADYQLEHRVELVQSDLFAALSGRSYDLIISNPPYVDAAEMAALPAEYAHEPDLALVGGGDGLDLVRVLLAQAGEHLNPGGVLIVEVGHSQEALAEAYPEVEFLWLEFAHGGSGVFLLSESQLHEYQSIFDQRQEGGRS